MNLVYQQIKKHYEETKPLRGQRASENIRPANGRRRTNECVVEVHRADGAWYGYRLYSTDVVLVSSAGVVEFNTGGWVSTSTAAFMHWVGYNKLNRLFTTHKRYNKIWVGWPRGYKFPLLENVTQFQINEDRQLTPLQPIVEQVPVISRKAMNLTMLPFKPMVEYMKTLHKLTNGVVTKETMDEHRGSDSWSSTFSFSVGCRLSGGSYPSRMYDEIERIATEGTTDDWTKLYCWMVLKYGYSAYQTQNYEDPVPAETIRNRIAKIVKDNVPQVWTSKPRVWA